MAEPAANPFQRSSEFGRARASAPPVFWKLGILAFFLIFAFTGSPAHAQATPNGAVNGLTPKFINAGGVRTRYYEMGHGEPLILIHGGGGASPNSANIWSLNIRPLSKHFLVIAPDRLGCGLTAGAFNDALNYPKQVVWLYNFLNALHLKKVNLVGHSAGGGTAFFFAVAHPDMVKTLTLVSAGTQTPGIFTVPQKLMVEMKSCPKSPLSAARQCRLGLLSINAKRTFNSQFWAANRYMNAWRARHYKVPAATPLKMHLAGINMKEFLPYRRKAWNEVRAGRLDHMPVLILYGKQDPLDWEASSPTAQLHGGLALFHILGVKDPNVQMYVLNDAAHFVYRDQPGEFDADVTHFVDFWYKHPAD